MMMVGNAISQGVPALAQAGLGVFQGIRARKMDENLVDPVYQIPNSVDKSIAMYADRADTNTMVGYDQAVQKLDQGMANTTNDILTAAGSGGDALGALVKANASNQNALNDLAFANASAVDSYEKDLMNAVAGRAAWEDKKFQIDVLDKFNRDAAAVSAMKNASIHNVFGGIKNIAGGAGDAFSIAAGDAQGLYDSGTKSTTASNVTGDLIGAVSVPQREVATTSPETVIDPAVLQMLEMIKLMKKS